MIAYKLCRQLKNGDITPLFINKKQRLKLNVWYDAEEHYTKGFKFRPYWHSTEFPEAPHLSTKNRVWVKCEIEDYHEIIRPQAQGGKWFLSNRIRFIEILPDRWKNMYYSDTKIVVNYDMYTPVITMP